MGRPVKEGLDYFPLDVDFFQDIKIRKLIKYQGGKAVTIYVLLLCTIYKSGYYMRWDKDMAFIVSEQTGFEESYILEVLKSCMVIGLFSKELFDKEEVLTSLSIQERFVKINSTCKRTAKMNKYNLVSSEETRVNSEETRVISEETPISSEETRVNSESSAQRKEKKRKGNKSKVNKENSSNEESKKVALSSPSEKIDWIKFKDYFNSIFSGKLSSINTIDEKRKRAVKARIAQYSKQVVFEVLQKVSHSDFLLGCNDRNWRCDFDWIFKPSNFTKIYEGNYDNKRNDTKQGRKQSANSLKDLAAAILQGTATTDGG